MWRGQYNNGTVKRLHVSALLLYTTTRRRRTYYLIATNNAFPPRPTQVLYASLTEAVGSDKHNVDRVEFVVHNTNTYKACDARSLRTIRKRKRACRRRRRRRRFEVAFSSTPSTAQLIIRVPGNSMDLYIMNYCVSLRGDA